MPLKSTQTAASKYDTMCWIQESPESSELSHNGYTVKKSATGQPFCIFEATLQTFDCYNRMGRRYDAHNVCQVIDTDERIQTLLKQNKWRGELNHPNPDIKGQQYTDIRMTIPEPLNSSHFISNNRLEGSKYKGTITTHPGTKAGICASSEVIDLGVVPSFSVRLLGNMLPHAQRNQPNIRVTKVITWDMVDFPSHVGADADIEAKYMEAATDVIFLKQLADYCSEESETLSVVCESFQISRDEILGIKDNNVIVEQADSSRLWIPLPSDIREEALSILRSRH
jgi:hypothetical protein